MDDPTTQILQLVDSLVSATPTPGAKDTLSASIDRQRLAAVQTCDALKQCLESIPNLQSTDNQLQALSTFGSLQQLSQSSVDDIVAYTGCSDEQAEALWEFWNMG
eukprot:jgi/Chrzof1/1065/Cz01g38300.t1